MPADTTPTNETVVRDPMRAEAGMVISERFKLVRCIASGGYGDVWSSEDLVEQRRVAVKILRNDAGNNDPSALARMRQEAQILAAIEHPNIVHVYSFQDSPYGYFLVMELLEGLAIDQILQREGPADPERIQPVVGQLLSALDTAHAKQILHRDIKPENIIMEEGPDGALIPKLLDFGIAKAMKLLTDSESGVTLVQTRSGGFIGTPRYSPPEQAVGDPIGPNVDLYSLGLVLAEWLSGVPRVTAERHGDVMAQLLNGEPHDVSDCPYPWQAWLKAMIAKSPSDRFQTATEAMKAFEIMVIEGSKRPDFLDDNPFVNPGADFEFGGGAFSDHMGPLELDFDRVERSKPEGGPTSANPQQGPSTGRHQALPNGAAPGQSANRVGGATPMHGGGGFAAPPNTDPGLAAPNQALNRPPHAAMERKELPPLVREEKRDELETIIMVGWLVVVGILACGVVFFLMLFFGMA